MRYAGTIMSRAARSWNVNQHPAHTAAQRAPAAFVRLHNPRSFSWRGFYFAYFYGAYPRQRASAHASG